MKRIAGFVVAVVTFTIVATTPVFAQDYPKPHPVGTPGTLCTVCAAPYTNLPVVPFPSQFKNFVGRFVDSSRAKSCQQPVRTIRAQGAKVAAERDRIYMTLGSTVSAYTLSTFSSRLAQGVTNGTVPGCFPGPPAPQWLVPDASFYAEISDWACPVIDGQDRLYDIDWDDRGYVYVAYTVFGWGILQDNNVSLTSVEQRPVDQADPVSGVCPGMCTGPQAISAFKAGTQYYVIVASDAEGQIWNVTTPSAPVFVRKSSMPALKISRTLDYSKIAVAYGTSSIGLFTSDWLLAGDTPKQMLTSAKGDGPLLDVASDGTNFWTVERTAKAASGLYRAWFIDGNTFQAHKIDLTSDLKENGNLIPFDPDTVSVGNGHLLVGSGGYLKLFKINPSNNLAEIPISAYFHAYTQVPPAGYARPNGYQSVKGANFFRHNEKSYLIYSGYGLGEVYEMEDSDSNSVSPKPTGKCIGSNPVTCTASDQCHIAGTCDATTGACTNPAAPDGTHCEGGTCQAGSCVPTNPGQGQGQGQGPGARGCSRAAGAASSDGNGPGALVALGLIALIRCRGRGRCRRGSPAAPRGRARRRDRRRDARGRDASGRHSETRSPGAPRRWSRPRSRRPSPAPEIAWPDRGAA